MDSLKSYERKRWSQHGEDGIIAHLTRNVTNKRFLEIGAAWAECNSRALIEDGWAGRVIDCGDVSQFPDAVSMMVTLKNLPQFPQACGFFSLDIDSYDYFIADALLRRGFRPEVVCLETNTFISGRRTVRYIEPFKRYRLQPKYGLYFGCSLDAWKHLWGQYGYGYAGMDSSFTNAFFVRGNGDTSDDFGYQEYFCKKYGMAGEALSKTLDEHLFLDVGSEFYEEAFAEGQRQPRIEAVTTFTKAGYEVHAKAFLDSWRLPIWCFEEPLLRARSEKHIYEHDISETRFPEFFAKYGKFNGKRGNVYNYVWDAVKWSHRIFALAEAARRTTADILINIDADVLVFEPFPDSFVRDLLTGHIAYLPRGMMYSECSFVIYRMCPLVRQFIEDHERMYLSGEILNLHSGWTDCHAFDALLRAYKERGLIATNINKGVPDCMHPSINGPLGKYMDNLKGNRKYEGRSRKSDLVVKRAEPYWQHEHA